MAFYFEQLIIITTGLLIAFWVENLRENKNEDRATKQILVNIKQDIIAITDTELGVAQVLDTFFVKKIDAAIDDIGDCKIDDVDLLYTVASFHISTNYPENSGFESLKSSGLMTNIEDDTLLMAFSGIFDFSFENAVDGAWEKSSDNILGVIYEAEGIAVLPMEEGKYKLVATKPIILSGARCTRLKIHLMEFRVLMQESVVRLKYNANAKKTWFDRLEREIKRK